MNLNRQVFYSGRVQGVGFRYTVKQIASGYEVVGWVRNLNDGRVELQASGEAKEVEAFLAAIGKSQLGSYIKEAVVSDVADAQLARIGGFEIRH